MSNFNFFEELSKLQNKIKKQRELKEKEETKEGKEIVKQIEDIVSKMLFEDGFKFAFPFGFLKAIGFGLKERGLPITRKNIEEVLKTVLSPADMNIGEAIDFLKEGNEFPDK